MLRDKISVYTRNINLVESQFLRREFNLILTEINEKNTDIIKKTKVCMLATTKPSELEEFLINAEPASLVIFLFGNETYDIQTFEYLNKYKEKILHAFVHNIPKRTSFWISLRCLLAALYDGGLSYKKSGENVFRHFKNGIDFMLRNRKINFFYSTSDFPYGYADLFANELEILKLISTDDSLFRNNFSSKLEFNKSTVISFFGASGSWNRRLAINKMKNLYPDCNIIFYENRYKVKNIFSAEKQILKTDYATSLIRSKFILCPPGNLTNRSYRYLESLIMGALPILPPATIQDNHHWGVWTEFIKPKHYSWTKCIKKALIMSEEERVIRVSEALYGEFQKIIALNKKLNEILGA